MALGMDHSELGEPTWSIRREELNPDQYYALCWIPIDSTEYRDGDESSVYTIPPKGYEIERTVHRADRDSCVVRLRSAARRVRSMLVCTTGAKIPVWAKFVGADLLREGGWGNEDLLGQLLIQMDFTQRSPDVVENWLSDAFEKAERLLLRTRISSTEDKLISLIGDSLWQESDELSYLKLWAIIDVVGDELEGANLMRKKLDKALAVLTPRGADGKWVKTAYGLRNTIAHGHSDEESDVLVRDLHDPLSTFCWGIVQERVGRMDETLRFAGPDQAT